MVNAPDGTGKKGAVPGIKVAGKTGTAQFWRNGRKDDHSWFLAFAPYDYPKIALTVMVEGGKSGGEVAAPIASEIIQKIFALDHGYDSGLKPLAPAIGNYDWADSVDFKAGNATTKLVSRDKMTPGNRSTDVEPDSSKVSRAQQVANDPRGAAYGHVIVRRAERVQLEQRSFSDFMSRDSEYRGPTQQSQQLAEKKKHHFLFF